MLVVDGHADIAYNAIVWGRDYTRSAHATRQAEQPAVAGRWTCTLGLPDWLAGNVAVIVSTLFTAPAHAPGILAGPLYHTPHEAYEQAMQQLDVYRRLADEAAHFRLVLTAADLEEVLAAWQSPHGEGQADERQVGLVVSMEGADPIVEPAQVEEWYAHGLRGIGLAWRRTRYAGGTHEPGPLTDEGKRLLRAMEEYGLLLDLSHCAELAFFQALDAYGGPVLASHSNPRKFVNTDRHLSDDMIRRLVERQGVLGILPVNCMLKPGWRSGDAKDEVTLADVVAAIDYVCQLAGSPAHVAIGSDFDGGFGAEDLPAELDTIADIGKIGQALLEHGYALADVEAVMHGNWLRMLRQVLP